jgi:anti-sigma-K factor RskA
MTTYSHEQLMELAAGYALGALTADENAAVEAALPGNARLAAEVQSMREAMGTMMGAEVPMSPAPGVRAEWLHRVRTGAPRQTATSDVASIATARSGRRLQRWALPAALAASLTGVLVLGVKLQQSNAALARAESVVEKRDRQLNTVLEAEKELLVAVLDARNTHGTGVQFFWNVRQNRGIVHAFHLPPAPAGRAYQVWVQRGDSVIPVRAFNSDPDGHALIEHLVLPTTPDGITQVAITIEPENGSAKPTTQAIMTGTLQRHVPPIVPGA